MNWHLVKQVMFNLYQNTILDWKSQCANHLPLFIDIYDIRCALESSIFFNRIETMWTRKTRIEDINLRILFLAVTSCKTFGKLFSMFSQNYVHLWGKCLEQISFSFFFFFLKHFTPWKCFDSFCAGTTIKDETSLLLFSVIQ